MFTTVYLTGNGVYLQRDRRALRAAEAVRANGGDASAAAVAALRTGLMLRLVVAAGAALALLVRTAIALLLFFRTRNGPMLYAAASVRAERPGTAVTAARRADVVDFGGGQFERELGLSGDHRIVAWRQRRRLWRRVRLHSSASRRRRHERV
jgi:hypothetical protein